MVAIDGKITRLTERADTYEGRPMWSSSNTVVFESVSFDKYNMPNSVSLMEAEVNGNATKTIINYTDGTGNYIFSPDLSKIAFVQAREVPNDEYVYSLHVMDANGDNPRKVADGFRHLDFDIRWSPNGRQIALQAAKLDQATSRIYLVDMNKGTARSLSSINTNEWHPTWSSTGRLAFIKDVGEYFPAIYVTDTYLVNQQHVAEIGYPIMAGAVNWLED